MEELIVAVVGVLAGSSIVANFFEVKESDKKWVKIVKKCVNILALNISAKAGR